MYVCLLLAVYTVVCLTPFPLCIFPKDSSQVILKSPNGWPLCVRLTEHHQLPQVQGCEEGSLWLSAGSHTRGQ